MRLLFAATFVVLSVWGLYMAATASEPNPPGKTTLVWATDDTPIRRAQIDLFNRLNPDLHVKMDPTNRDPNKVIVQSLGGVGPDVFDVPGNALPIMVNSRIARDLTADLTAKGIDPKRDFWPASGPFHSYQGRIYAVPANLDSLALFYNKSVFDEAGVPYPSDNPTWDEIIDLGKRLTERESNGRVQRFGLLFWWNWRDFFALEGAQVFSEDGLDITLDSPQARRALTRMFDLIYTHKISPTPSESNSMATQGGWGGGNENRFVAGRAAMVLGPRYFTAHFRRAEGMRVGVARLPLAPGGGSPIRGRGVAMSSRTKHPAAALRFLAFVAGPDYNRLNNAMADGVGPTMRYTEEPGFLFDPAFPEEKSNGTWRSVMLSAQSDRTSPFLDSNKIDEAMHFHLDLVSQGRKTPADALRDAQAQAEMLKRQNLERNPDLATAYQKAREAQR